MKARPRAASTTVFVIAPDRELRQSLEFLFRAEGMTVIALGCVPDRIDLPESGPVCAVVDENAVADVPNGWASLAAFPRPVILLVDRLHRIPEYYMPVAIHKPLLGHRLVEAVFRASKTAAT